MTSALPAERATAHPTTDTQSARRLKDPITAALRVLAMDAVEKAKSGHPGMPMGMAEIAAVLWRGHLRHNPANPSWPNRDRFVLSNGHGSMLLYALLHLTGYDLPLDELARFRQLRSTHARASRVRRHPRRRDHHGSARPGPRERSGHGARRAHARRAVQSPRLRRSSTIARTCSSATAVSWKASVTKSHRWPGGSDSTS